MQQSYRHGLQDLFDDVSGVSLTVVSALHDPGNKRKDDVTRALLLVILGQKTSLRSEADQMLTPLYPVGLFNLIKLRPHEGTSVYYHVTVSAVSCRRSLDLCNFDHELLL